MPVALGGRCRSRKVGLRTALRRSDRARHEAVFEDTIVDSSQRPAHAQRESDVLRPEGRRCASGAPQFCRHSRFGSLQSHLSMTLLSSRRKGLPGRQ